VLEGHDSREELFLGRISACSVSPDGAFVVSGGEDGSLRVWDPRSGAERLVFKGHADWLEVEACAVSPDGGFVVSASDDRTLQIWDPRSGRRHQVLAGHDGAVNDCAVSPDGELVVSASDDHTLRMWDPGSGASRQVFEGHTGRVSACLVSPDGKHLVSASEDYTLRIWDLAAGTERAMLPLLGDPRGVTFEPSRPLAVCGDAGGTVYIFDLVGIEYGPIIVTAVDFGSGPVVRCPLCLAELPLPDDLLGAEEMRCTEAGCEGRMRVNPFVAGRGPDAG
jgi:WD40 repeat protein